LKPVRVDFGRGDLELIVAGRLLFFGLIGFAFFGPLLIFLLIFDDFLGIFFFIFFVFVFFVLHYDSFVVMTVFFELVVLDVSDYIANVQVSLSFNFLADDLLHDGFFLFISLIAFETGQNFVSNRYQCLLRLIFYKLINAAKIVFVDGL
jgi:hypothetical protein